MEKKLAERLAARAAAGELTNELEELPLSPPEPPSPSHEVDPPPDSGVRASFADAHPDDLSYSVYTVAELEARRQGRPPRMSMAFAPTVSVTAPSRW
ncbi:MAG TPA: hypothetical protein VM925_15095, partial [Labilithrix sp.]|nr:hypothetical protein [Labilithrix sp.]